MADPIYLGDSVYARFDGYHISIFTDNGFGPQNLIHLEPSVIDALNAYRESSRKEYIEEITSPPADEKVNGDKERG